MKKRNKISKGAPSSGNATTPLQLATTALVPFNEDDCLDTEVEVRILSLEERRRAEDVARLWRESHAEVVGAPTPLPTREPESEPNPEEAPLITPATVDPSGPQVVAAAALQFPQADASLPLALRDPRSLPLALRNRSAASTAPIAAPIARAPDGVRVVDRQIQTAAEAQARHFKIGQHVEMRDTSAEDWRLGVVTALTPKLLVRFENRPQGAGLEWQHVRANDKVKAADRQSQNAAETQAVSVSPCSPKSGAIMEPPLDAETIHTRHPQKLVPVMEPPLDVETIHSRHSLPTPAFGGRDGMSGRSPALVDDRWRDVVPVAAGSFHRMQCDLGPASGHVETYGFAEASSSSSSQAGARWKQQQEARKTEPTVGQNDTTVLSEAGARWKQQQEARKTEPTVAQNDTTVLSEAGVRWKQQQEARQICAKFPQENMRHVSNVWSVMTKEFEEQHNGRMLETPDADGEESEAKWANWVKGPSHSALPDAAVMHLSMQHSSRRQEPEWNAERSLERPSNFERRESQLLQSEESEPACMDYLQARQSEVLGAEAVCSFTSGVHPLEADSDPWIDWQMVGSKCKDIAKRKEADDEEWHAECPKDRTIRLAETMDRARTEGVMKAQFYEGQFHVKVNGSWQEVEEEFWCRLCDEAVAKTSLAAHLDGQKHFNRFNVSKFVMEAAELTSVLLPWQERSDDGKQIICIPCKKKCDGYHEQTQAHKRKIEDWYQFQRTEFPAPKEAWLAFVYSAESGRCLKCLICQKWVCDFVGTDTKDYVDGEHGGLSDKNSKDHKKKLQYLLGYRRDHHYWRQIAAEKAKWHPPAGTEHQFSCARCNKRFAGEVQWRQHMKDLHGIGGDGAAREDKQKKLECVQCIQNLGSPISAPSNEFRDHPPSMFAPPHSLPMSSTQDLDTNTAESRAQVRPKGKQHNKLMQ